MAPGLTLSPESLKYIVHHVFLPPRLPQSDDFDESYEHQLLCVVLNASEYTLNLPPARWCHALMFVVAS